MEFVSNENKSVEISVNGSVYKRHAIKTHFVQVGESYIDVIQKYVSPIYEEGDIISISEKIIALCQKRVVRREEIKVGCLAKFLSKFASHPKTGIGVGEAIKMQYAINKVGAFKCIYAAIASAFTKLFGKRGVFYKIVGQEVSGLDGFYPDVWKEYGDIGIEMPENPKAVCNEIYEKLGIKAMIVDANDLGQELLGYSDVITESEEELLGMIKDNPAGQGKQTTPIILIRKANENQTETNEKELEENEPQGTEKTNNENIEE